MIRSFRHKGLERFFQTGSKAGIQAAHAERLRNLLGALDAAETLDELSVPGWLLHPLKGSMADRWSLRVNGNWRLTFRFVDRNVEVLDYEDYH